MGALILASAVPVLVGCNTGSADHQALHVLAVDPETGRAEIVQSVKGFEGTTYFQVSPDGRFVYSVIGEKRDDRASSSVVRFSWDGHRLGPLERIADLTCEAPCHLSLSPDGRRVFTASYLSATVASLASDGSDLRTYVFPDDAMGPNALRQKKAYAHFTFMTPDASRLGVIDLGCDRIRFFDPVTLRPDPLMEICAQPGEGPRHAAWSKDGKFLFVINELGSSVASYAFDGARFTRVGDWSMLPDGFARWEKDGRTLATKAAAIRLTADGSLFFASNRGCDSIAIFAVSTDGTLVRRNVAPLAGRFPRDFEFLPGERFVIVGHKMSNEIRIYRFDRGAFTLAPVGEPITCWRPLCFKILSGGTVR